MPARLKAFQPLRKVADVAECLAPLKALDAALEQEALTLTLTLTLTVALNLTLILSLTARCGARAGGGRRRQLASLGWCGGRAAAV